MKGVFKPMPNLIFSTDDVTLMLNPEKVITLFEDKGQLCQ